MREENYKTENYTKLRRKKKEKRKKVRKRERNEKRGGGAWAWASVQEALADYSMMFKSIAI